MVIGGILCCPHEVEGLRLLVREAQGRFPDAMKWERIRKNNRHRYENLVRRYFALCREHRADFGAVVLDTRQFDHARHNDGDDEMGFHKFLAQHLFRHARAMGRQASFVSLYAHRTSRRNLAEVQNALNGMCSKRYGDGRARFLGLSYRAFRTEPVFSLVDILIGAVGAAYNETILGSAKAAVAETIRIEARLDTLAAPTDWTRKNFDIWEFDLDQNAASLAPSGGTAAGSTDRFGSRRFLNMRRTTRPFKFGA